MLPIFACATASDSWAFVEGRAFVWHRR